VIDFDGHVVERAARFVDYGRKSEATVTALLLVNQVDQPVAAELCRVDNDCAHDTFAVRTDGGVLSMALSRGIHSEVA